MQAFFAPTHDGIKGFELLKQSVPKTFSLMLDNLEANYISNFKRCDLRFCNLSLCPRSFASSYLLCLNSSQLV